MSAIAICVPMDVFAVIAEETGFALQGHALECYGYCPSCIVTAAGSGTMTVPSDVEQQPVRAE